ncbi:hypothetical protein GCM10009731_05350 [Streptomyces globosus]
MGGGDERGDGLAAVVEGTVEVERAVDAVRIEAVEAGLAGLVVELLQQALARDAAVRGVVRAERDRERGGGRGGVELDAERAWTAPSLAADAVAFRRTPELVRGVAVADPLMDRPLPRRCSTRRAAA